MENYKKGDYAEIFNRKILEIEDKVGFSIVSRTKSEINHIIFGHIYVIVFMHKFC